MTHLGKRQRERAAILSERHTSAELGRMCEDAASRGNDADANLYAWAVYLRQQAERPSPACGYTGRNHN